MHYPAKTEVDSTGHKGRGDGQTHDLHEESVVVPLVLPAHDTANIAEDFQNDAAHHRNREGRGTSGEGIGEEVPEERDAKESSKGGIGAYGHTVEVVGQVDVTGL